MTFLSEQLQTPAEMVELPVDDLGLRLLRLLAIHLQGQLLSRHDIGLAGAWRDHLGEEVTQEFLRAGVEAYDWLETNGLVAVLPADSNDRSFVTRRGHRIAEADDGRGLLRSEARIDVDLHPLIATRVRRQFLLGEYELAALATMKQFEIRVRELAGAEEGTLGCLSCARHFTPMTGY
jgi:hypothetical protein